MESYDSETDNETYYSYDNVESERDFEEEEEPDYQLENEDEYYDDYHEYVPIDEIKPEKTLKVNLNVGIPEINPWTKKKNSEMNQVTDTPKSLLDIIKEEEILKKKREENEKRKQKFRKNNTNNTNRRPNDRRPYSNKFSSSTPTDKPVQSLLLAHKLNNQKKV